MSDGNENIYQRKTDEGNGARYRKKSVRRRSVCTRELADTCNVIEPRGSVLIRLAVTSRPDVPRRRRRREAAAAATRVSRPRAEGAWGHSGQEPRRQRVVERYAGTVRRRRWRPRWRTNQTRAHRVWRRPVAVAATADADRV